ncbi:hypothetical protein N507_2853 [Lacticaseibacillus rhamnosus DSM 14870]|nr:hypothetical protein N507_2853 [Lacticaseibacillus rhamnosus DSM 14870]
MLLKIDKMKSASLNMSVGPADKEGDKCYVSKIIYGNG